LVLSIHIAQNAVTMIMTTVLLCFKGFFHGLAENFLVAWPHLFYSQLAAKRQFLQPAVSLL